MTPADRILKHLNDNGIKQTWLAEKIGMRKNTLNAKLHNQVKISAEEVEAICWALGIKPNDVLKPKKEETA